MYHQKEKQDSLFNRQIYEIFTKYCVIQAHFNIFFIITLEFILIYEYVCESSNFGYHMKL